ncbi:hypothetical protein FNF27_07006 [Cafeteria roenbergensis]|uniref:Ubiquitin-like domain-containing protein n=1 Tax=Cafeteria roenbergensis TaxID=33653 RepID=A0A5A8DV82_CAFRO|nr:hypothetical protein FNF29_02467 [Cafeteria roenbergensis]KAA0169326.1 hypothetical protein FNF27_07006 [Cafeteria roenbergensis]|eukprot:KAA0154245.1 hypothetical protein FNF29_02467 [Cafeteria roenbergensis]
MRLRIHSVGREFVVSAKRSDFVARLKANFARTARLGKHSIVLQFAGETLPDDATLKSLGITREGMMLYHVHDGEGVAAGYGEAADYDARAAALEAARGASGAAADPVDFDAEAAGGGADWDPTWRGGDSWRTTPAMPVPEDADAAEPVYECTVGRFAFRLLHTLEGRWNGEAEVLLPGSSPARDAAAAGARVSLTSLWFDGERGVWVERQRFTGSDGVSTSQCLTLVPVADGVCRVDIESAADDDGDEHHAPHRRHSRSRRAAAHPGSAPRDTDGDWGGSDVELKLQEVGGNMLLLTGVHRSSGRPVLVETMTVIDSLRRARTVQRFDAAGSLQSVFAIREARVIDAVSGAIDKRSRA